MKNIIMSLTVLALLSGINTVVAIAEAQTVTDQAISNTILPTPVPNPGFEQSGYYTYRPDMRECVSPVCGGFFVKQVNKKFTICADGSYQNECYVSGISWATKDAPPLSHVGNLLIQGAIAKKYFPPFGSLGVFKVNAAYKAATNKILNTAVLFAGLQQNGLVCITTPCFSYDEYILNSSKTRMISGVNLKTTGATEKQLASAYERLANGKLLIAAGYNRQINKPFGLGITFEAKEFYLPVKKPTGICPDGYISNGGQCVTPTIGCIAPQIELEASGGAVSIDPVTGQIQSNITRSCINRCDPPAILYRPAHCSVFYP
jgi:hypothetical protein